MLTKVPISNGNAKMLISLPYMYSAMQESTMHFITFSSAQNAAAQTMVAAMKDFKLHALRTREDVMISTIWQLCHPAFGRHGFVHLVCQTTVAAIQS